MKILLIFFLMIPLQDLQTQVIQGQTEQLTIQEAGDRYIIFDTKTNEFIEVDKSESSADSLLEVSNRLRETDTQASLLAARQARVISEDLEYLDGAARAYNLLGINYANMGDYEEAIQFYVLAMDIEEELGNDSRVAVLLGNFATVYTEQGNLEMTRRYYQESIDRLRKIGETDQIYTSVNNMGVVHRRQGEYDKALDYFFEASEGALAAEPPDSNLYMIAMLNIGNTYRNKEDLDTAIPFFSFAEEYFERNSQSLSLAYLYNFSAALYRDLGDHDRALQYISKAITISEEELYRERLVDAYLIASTIYESINDYTNAFSSFRSYHAINDSIRNVEASERLSELQVRFEVNQKDQEIALLSRDAALANEQFARQELQRNFLGFGVIISLILIALLIYINRIRKNKNSELRESRLEIEEQNKKLSKLNQEKDEFLSLAAHDLRSPLSSVIMIADLIKNTDNISQGELDEYTNLIHLSSEKMLTLINNLLEVQSEKIKYESEELDIMETLQNVVENFQNAAERKKISIKIHSTVESLPIQGISNYVMRIFDNLISNAVKYSPPESVVTISAEAIDGFARITVHDQGPGIPEDEEDKLFKQFGTTSNKPTGNEQSTGLGLYIVKKFTNTMNGSVWYEGEPGKGSSFIVEFKLLNETDTTSSQTSTVSEKVVN